MCATQLLAPRPTVSPPANAERFIVAGYLTACTGLGESARLCYEALRTTGGDVSGIDLSGLMMHGADRSDFQYVDGSQNTGPGVLLLVVNAPWVPLALLKLGRRLVKFKRVIGYWAWELPEIPDEWLGNSSFVHEIWTPSRFVAAAVSKRLPRKPVCVIPYPVALSTGRTQTAIRQKPIKEFVVLVVFNVLSSFARKNPLAAIRAFRAAFDDDPTARLIVKATYLDRLETEYSTLKAEISGANNVSIITQSFTPLEMDQLYASADVVLSLHRSEGFGFVVAEAMLRGIPVIATDWSGTSDFLSFENGLPVSYRMVPASDPQGEYDCPTQMWADPDIDDAAAKLRLLRNDPALRQRLGDSAKQSASSLFSTSRYVELVQQTLTKRG